MRRKRGKKEEIERRKRRQEGLDLEGNYVWLG